MILYLAADLIWASRIKATAEALGIAARPVRSLEMLEARLADSPVTAILLDLEKPEEALVCIARLKGNQASTGERAVRVVAWGPHVAADLLQQARMAGADAVLTRGAFDHRLPELLKELADGGGPTGPTG
jgi:CheY-like chemotaxis protein